MANNTLITDEDKQFIDQIALSGRVRNVINGNPNAMNPRARLPVSQRLLTAPPANAIFDFLAPQQQTGPSRVVKNLALGGPAPVLKTLADFLDNPMRLSPAGAAMEQAGLIKPSPTAEALRLFAETGEQGLAVQDPGFVDALTQGAGSMITAAGPGMMAGRAAMLAGPRMALPAAIAVPTVMEAAQEGTGAKERALQKGMTPQQASLAERTTAGGNLPLLALTNAAGPMGDLMKKAMGKATTEGLIKGLIKGALTEGPLQEAPQQVITNVATGDPAMQNVGEAAAIGSILGAGVGGGVGLTNTKETKEELKQAQEAIKKAADAAKELPAKVVEINKRLGNAGQAVVPFGEAKKPPQTLKIPVEPFYSKLERTIQEKMPNAATPEQVRGILSGSGVKQEEIDWTDVEGALEGKEKVSKQELLDHIQSNNVQINEVEKADRVKNYKIDDIEYKGIEKRGSVNFHIIKVPDNVLQLPVSKYPSKASAIERALEKTSGIDDTKFGPKNTPDLNIPGGENYKELLLTLPPKSPSLEKRALDTFGVPLDQLSADERAELAQTTSEGKKEIFSSSHFDEPNILAHVRMNDRIDADGKKVLFVEEVQSDWNQKGRKEGYRDPGLIQMNFADWLKKNNKFVSDSETTKQFNERTGDDFKNWQEEQQLALKNTSKVPDAPFKKTWHEMAMKRILRHAVEKGYDRVAWTTGEQQAERYDLSKQVDEIRVMKTGHGSYGLTIRKDGQTISPKGANKAGKIKMQVGADEKALAQAERSGDSNAIGDALGRSVEVHSIDITPAMRQSIMTEGQTLFEKGPEVAYNTDEAKIAFGSEQAAKGAINEAIKEAENPKESIFNNRPTPEILRQEAKARQEIARQLRQRGFVDYRGTRVESVQDIADLARLFRNPRVEHLQALMFKDGVLVAHRVVSSGIVNAVGANAKYINSVVEAAKRVGADEVYFAHNHPTGNPNPSQEDINFTTVADDLFYERGVSLNGHIVTDGDKYAFISNRGKVAFNNFRQPMANPERYNDPSMSSPELVFDNAKAFVKHGLTTVVFLNARNQIVGIDAVKKYENAPDYIKSKKSFYDATAYIVMFTDQVNVQKFAKRMPPGLLDIITVIGKDKFSAFSSNFATGFWTRSFINPDEQERLNKKANTTFAVQEEQNNYDPAGWDEGPDMIQFKPEEQDLADKAQMELEMMAYTGSLHPLEAAMKDVGKIGPNANGRDMEEYMEIPERFRDPKAEEIGKTRQKLSNNHGLDFENDSDLRAALKALGDKPRRFILSKDVQDFLKIKENVDKFEAILSKKMSPKRYRQIIESNVGIRQKKKPLIIKTTEEQAFKELLRVRQKASREGYVAGKKEAEQKAKIDAQSLRKEFTALKGQMQEKFGEKSREMELKTLKDDILRRNIERMRADLIDYIQQTVEPRYRGRFLRTVQNVRTARGMERAIEMATKTQDRFDESAERREMYEAIMGIKTDRMSDFNKEAIREIQDKLKEYRRGGMGEEKLEKLHRLRQALQKDPDNELPDYVMDELEALEKKPFKELSTDELRTLFLSAMQHEKLEKLKQVIRVGQREREFNEVLNEVLGEMHTPPKYEKLMDRIAKEGTPTQTQEALTKFRNTLRDIMITAQERYDLLVDSLSKVMHRGTIHKILYQSIRDAAIKTNTIREDFRKEYNEMLIDIGFKPSSKWFSERVPTKIGGIMIPLTRDERISLAIHAQNESGRRHLTGDIASGFVLNSARNQVLYHPTDEELDNLVNSLDVDERRIIDLNDEITGSIWEKMNEVFKEKNGFSMGRVQNNYIHQQVSKDHMNPVIRDMSIVEELKNTYVKIGLYKGFTKDRVKSKAPIVLVKYFEALTNHIDGSATYIALEAPLANATKLLYDPSFRSDVVTKFGAGRYKAIEGVLRDLAGRGSQETALIKAMNWMYNQTTRTVFGWNPKTFVKQYLGLVNATPYLSPGELMNGLAVLLRNEKAALDYLIEFSPWYRNRAEIGFLRELSDLQKKEMVKSISARTMNMAEKAVEFIIEKQLESLKYSDKQAVAVIMYAAKHKKLAELEDVDMDIDEKEVEALKYAEEIAELTQNSSNIVNRSQMSLSRNPIEKGLTFGQGDSNTVVNLIIRNWRDAARNPSKEKTSRLIATIFMAIAIAAPNALVDWFFLQFVYGNKDYQYKNFKEAIPWVIANQATSLNYFGVTLNPILHHFRTGKMPNFSYRIQAAKPLEDSLVAVFDTIKALTSDVDDEKKLELNKKAVKSIIRGASSFGGVGLINQAVSFYERNIEFTPEEIKDEYKRAVKAGDLERLKSAEIKANNAGMLIEDMDKKIERTKSEQWKKFARTQERKTRNLSDDEFRKVMIEKGRRKEITRDGANYIAKLRAARIKKEQVQQEKLRIQNNRIKGLVND